MIPKTIHYCWFGGKPKPKLTRKCIKSWNKHLPEYTVKEWNETNFDINSNEYVKEAYTAKKWAFVTDYVRLYALLTEGGIYMDTDTEVLKPLNQFLTLPAFSGFESNSDIPTCIIGAEKDSKWIEYLIKHYDNAHFVNQDGSYDMTTNVQVITSMMMPLGLKRDNTTQCFSELVTLFPSDYFCAKDWRTGIICTTSNTFCIHHFAGSWLPQNDISTYRRWLRDLRACGRKAMALLHILSLYRNLRYGSKEAHNS